MPQSTFITASTFQTKLKQYVTKKTFRQTVDQLLTKADFVELMALYHQDMQSEFKKLHDKFDGMDVRVIDNEQRLREHQQWMQEFKEQRLKADKRIAQNDRLIARADENIAQNKKMLARADKKIAQNERLIAKADKKIAQNERLIAKADKKIAQNERLIAKADKKIAQNEKRFAEDKKRYAKEQKRRDQADAEWRKERAELLKRLSGTENRVGRLEKTTARMGYLRLAEAGTDDY